MRSKLTEVGKIPQHWEVVSIQEIGEVVGGGTPSTKKEEYYGGDIPWITPKDLSGYGKKGIKNGERNITEEGLKGSSAKLMPKNTVLLSSRAPIGYVAISENPVTTNQGFKSIICNESRIIPDFLYYVLKTSKASLEAISSGSTFKEVSGSAVKSFKIPLPPISEQKVISNILSAIDDKIEHNQAVIQTLEQLSQTLFKHWFIDFEYPNENGKPYLSKNGKMIESKSGAIPEKWKVGTLQDLGEIVGGGTPSKKRQDFFTYQGIPWITPKDLSNNKSIFIGKGSIDITVEGLRKSSAKLLPKNTILFSSRAPIGYIAIAAEQVSTNQGFKSIVPNENFPFEYVYLLLKHITPIIESNASGSTFKEISGNGMKAINILIPTSEMLEKFKGIVSPIFCRIKETEKEILSLREMRDSLLLKTLSGEIEIPTESEELDHVQL